ncbi:hypothetical protein HPB50_001122 [Hyalomma asiaticum]|uniref:Uncharacterized protein n=1 Tax=Hyalomma asiaticum TaxID=266040 RepID=A0ACB7S003_HYAAI|nr:hypothetical protein HPB50_001122 [Hyalomma asiaticum]
MKNIALAFVRMGQLVDAVTSLEYIMAERADFRTALHLVVCQYHLAISSVAGGGADKVRRSFLKLLDVSPEQIDEFDKYEPSQSDPAEMLYYEEIKNDSLQQIERERRHEAEWCISTAAKLISPVISSSFSEGYEWCLEQIKSSAYAHIANDLEISKAVAYLRKREFNQAIETLKAFERKDTKVASTAATNLSFLYYLQKDLSQADKYADQAVQADRYNAGALVNKGNCCFSSNDLDRAVEYYREALTTEASCVEALYNQGAGGKKRGRVPDELNVGHPEITTIPASVDLSVPLTPTIAVVKEYISEARCRRLRRWRMYRDSKWRVHLLPRIGTVDPNSEGCVTAMIHSTNEAPSVEVDKDSQVKTVLDTYVDQPNKLGSLEEALDCFFKLRAIVKTIPQVLYQIGRTYPFSLPLSKHNSAITLINLIAVATCQSRVTAFCLKRKLVPLEFKHWSVAEALRGVMGEES